MKDVFLITHGCYSDYRVVAAFSTKKKAQDFIDEYTASFGGDLNIETYALDFKMPVPDMWEVVITPDGAKRVVRNITYEFKHSGSGSYLFDYLLQPPRWGVRDVEPGRPQGCRVTDKSFTVYCFAKDEPHGLKVARDAMRGVVAQGLWKNEATGPLA